MHEYVINQEFAEHAEKSDHRIDQLLHNKDLRSRLKHQSGCYPFGEVITEFGLRLVLISGDSIVLVNML